MKKVKQLGDLQMAIMQVLWRLGERTLVEIQAALKPQRDLAATTIATVLSRLEKSGLIAHRAKHRKFIYRSIVSEEEIRRDLVSDLVAKLFQGDTTALVSHLIRESEISADDLEHVKALIEAEENKERGDDGD